jgi:signal transduction histidine kinase
VKVTQVTQPTTQSDASGAPQARQPLTQNIIGWLIIVRNVALPLVIALLCLWVAISGLPERKQAPHNAVIVLGIVTIIVAFVARRARDRLRILGAEDSAIPNTLPDLTGSLYLVILVLAGAPIAIIFAIATPFIARAPELSRGRQVMLMALRQSMTSSVTLLAAGFAYASVSAVIPHVPTALRAHVLAAVAASIVFLVGVTVARLLLQPTSRPEEFRRAALAYLTGPALLFQVLLLSCVPLLPLTESLQPVEIEFAWVLLLTPMGAVFYLALTSARLRQQTNQLQQTISELNATRLRETQLKSYAALITRAQEDERRRLARELHDDTAQALIALSRGLDALSDRHINPVSSPDDMRFLDQLVDLTQRTLESVRRACQDLRPSVLDDLGLSAALESLAGAMTERGMPCDYAEYGTAQPFPLEVEVAVYRIAQEALSNALRHSEPSQAQIELRYRPGSLRLVVSDDGHGFDVSAILTAAPGGASRSTAPENGSGLGLMGMRERAALIGATLDIQSAPGVGTRIILEAPADAPLTLLPDDATNLHELTFPIAR